MSLSLHIEERKLTASGTALSGNHLKINTWNKLERFIAAEKESDLGKMSLAFCLLPFYYQVLVEDSSMFVMLNL